MINDWHLYDIKTTLKHKLAIDTDKNDLKSTIKCEFC